MLQHCGGGGERRSVVRSGVLVAAVAGVVVSAGALGGQKRDVGITRQTLMLDGSSIGLLRSVEGGAIVGEVAQSPGPDPVSTKKQIAGTRYEDITIELGPAMGKGVYDWIVATWAGSGAPKSGSIVTADFNYKAQAEREFANALITATTFPALDGTSKDPFTLKVTLTPQIIRLKPGSGSDIRGEVGPKQVTLLSSNFRFEMDGLDANRVSRIESFTVRRPVMTDQVGVFKERTVQGTGRIEFPNLKVTLSEQGSESWMNWHQDFVVNGNNGDDREKNGAIVLMTPTKRDVLRVDLQNCGLFRLAPEPTEGTTAVRRLTAELYCERMQLSMPGGVALRGGDRSSEVREGL